jgi:uncharacterized protein YlxP (DUF503 family)
MVLRRVKDRVRQKFNVAIAEVGSQDLWQRAVLGYCVVGSDRRFVESALDEVVRFVRHEGEVQGEVTNTERDIQTFGEAFGDNDLGFKFG